jgi:L-malate glycosyltransferase
MNYATKRVMVIQTQMKQYRAPLWARLFDSLRADGIQLIVAYSDPPEVELRKNDNCELPPEYGLKVHGYWLWPEGLVYQPLLRSALRSDVVIVEQRNRLLLNHLLLPLCRSGVQRVAFWGQGRNYLPEQIRFSEWFRRKMLNWVYWWFAYTEGNARYLEAQGVPVSKITVLSNSLDTQEISDRVRSLKAQDREVLRGHLGIPVLAPVGIFCGALDKAKGLRFLIESSRIIKAQMPAFHLIIVGGGPEQDAVLRFTEGLDWVHWVGPQFGKRKAELMAISDAFLLPCKVGLAVLDAFAAGLPLITTKFEFHAPEIEYLEEGVNGLISDAEPGAFAETVLSLLSRTDYLASLRAGASASAGKYSIENMAKNFRRGIRSCLGLSVSSATVLGLQKAH